jgi:hypothetical protein
MKLQWWCEVPQVSVVENVVTLPSFVRKSVSQKSVLLLTSECKSEDMVHKKRGGDGNQWETLTAVYI